MTPVVEDNDLRDRNAPSWRFHSAINVDSSFNDFMATDVDDRYMVVVVISTSRCQCNPVTDDDNTG